MTIARSTIGFLDLPIAAIDLPAAADAIVAMAGADRFAYVVTPNVDHVVALHQATPSACAFRAAYRDAALMLCDSRILARLAHLSGLKLPVVTGSDLTAALFEGRRLDGLTVAIVGGDEALVARLADRFSRPRYRHHRPPMGVLNDPAAIAEIVTFVVHAQADIVLFAMGAPQSEIVAHKCRDIGTARGVGLCIGASLQFLTADQRRAPHWVQRAGMEWVFRLLSEPRRLWRRYLVEGPRIFSIWWRWRRTGTAPRTGD